MTRREARSRARYISAIACAVVLGTLSGGETRALSTGVVISQVYGGGGNTGAPLSNDFIEIFNRGASPVSLDGWSVQYASATGTGHFGGNPITALSGTLAPGQYYLIQQMGGATGLPLPTPNAIGTVNMSGAGGKVALVSSTTGLACNGGSTACTPADLAQIVDLVGYGSADFFEGAGATAAPGNTTSVFRQGAGCTETDNNSTDFIVAAPAPRNSASMLAPCQSADAAPNVSSTTPVNGATGVAATANVIVTFNEPVSVINGWYTLVCSLSGTKTAAVTGGPLSYVINPTVDFAAGDSCTLTVNAANVSDQDAIDPPDKMTANVVVSFSVTNVCAAAFTPIPAIQGSGDVAAITGTVTTRGVVVGDYEGATPALRGFYIQDPVGDGDAATSDGIFIFNFNSLVVGLGDVVVVTGTASEFQGQTQVQASSVIKCGTGTVAPTSVFLPGPLERYEGMLVSLPQALVVTDTEYLGRFGAVGVSFGGRLRQPTDVVTPGPLAAVVQAENDLNRLIIDDATNSQNPAMILFGRNGAQLSASNTLRAGDTVTGAVGVMTYTWAGNSASGNAFRVRPIGAMGGAAMFVEGNPRPAGPPAPAADAVRVASLNVLNFFNTFGAGACTQGEGGAATDCRGASNATEFARQWPKTIAAILGTQADIVGLVEIENDGYGPASAIQFLVDQLNAATAPGTFAFINADAGTGQVNALGTDAIKVGIVYKPARVTPAGQTAALNTIAFVNGGDSAPRNRPAIAQAFATADTGARFVVSVNHLKSKGSACDAPDAGDGQGNCNAVRVAAAAELAAWLASDPTGTGDPDVLITGDLNAYRQEDPVVRLMQAGFENLGPILGGGFTYVFDGQWGSLDHAMATATLRPQVVAMREWAINAEEPVILDYNTEFKSAGQIVNLYAPNEFRMADHNPLLVDVVLTPDPDPDAHVTAGAHLRLSHSAGLGAGDRGSQMNVNASVKFKKDSTRPAGEVTITVRRTVNGERRTYEIKALALTMMLRDAATSAATILGNATIYDVTDDGARVVVDNRASLRLVLVDNGEPGIRRDTVAVTVLDRNRALWFSSHWDGSVTVPQAITGGNIQVR